MAEEKGWVELIWDGKRERFVSKESLDRNYGPVRDVKRISLPFQRIELLGIDKKRQELPLFPQEEWPPSYPKDWKNLLIWGDNKIAMSSLIEGVKINGEEYNLRGKIKLIYIDPPFATGADFSFKVGMPDEWKSVADKNEIVKAPSILEELAYRDMWGGRTPEERIASYLNYMYERLVLMKELLSNDGSIYVHLDYRMVHYVKLIMDEIFGRENFRNEIVWRYGKMASSSGKFLSNHDTLLFYSKSEKVILDLERVKVPLEKPIKRLARKVEGGRLVNVKDESGRLQYVIKTDRYVDDTWDDIPIVMPASTEFIEFPTQKPEKLLERIILASSNPGDLVADFFCGSGTTLAVAEKLGRRWIGCDLSRYAIHLTRKRLLEIEKSKDLLNEGRKYNKKARAFEILNLGKYERQFWQIKTFTNKDEKQALYEYLAFILKLYGAEPVTGFTHIHGKKGNALIYIGAVDSPVTIQEVIEAMEECEKLGNRELHILGWEWEMGLNDAIQEIAKQKKIKLKLRTIPMEVLDRQAVEKGDIRFFELAYFKVDIKVKNKKVWVELKDFVIPHTDLIPDDVKQKIKEWTDWIDYWAIDFDFRNDTFNNGWTSYRTKKERTLILKADHTYKNKGKYKIFVKVIDIFGIDTSQVYEVEAK